jgi:hypothetical protein
MCFLPQQKTRQIISSAPRAKYLHESGVEVICVRGGKNGDENPLQRSERILRFQPLNAGRLRNRRPSALLQVA